MTPRRTGAGDDRRAQRQSLDVRRGGGWSGIAHAHPEATVRGHAEQSDFADEDVLPIEELGFWRFHRLR